MANLSTKTTICAIAEYLESIGGNAQTAPTTETKTSGVDISALVLAVISDKTGYPTDMMDADMELETDLGIDSIKRVEILSEINKQMGDIFTADDVANLSTKTTIRAIAEYLESVGGIMTATAETSFDTAVPAEASSGFSAEAIEKVVLDSISDKTGYPTDMIDVTMELETDLGIDSIKRVEIFSAVFESLKCSLTPDEVGEMSALSDIQGIVAFLAKKSDR